MDHQAMIHHPLCAVYICLNGGKHQDCLAVLRTDTAGRHWGCAAANMGLHHSCLGQSPPVLPDPSHHSLPSSQWVYEEEVTLRKLSFNLMRPLRVYWRVSDMLAWLHLANHLCLLGACLPWARLWRWVLAFGSCVGGAHYRSSHQDKTKNNMVLLI